VNEVATYFEYASVLHDSGHLGTDAVDNWLPAVMYWKKLGPVLREARTFLGSDRLWEGFESLANDQAGR
jgi:hypothetical protein